MVFPIGALIWEIAADHLDRLPGKSLIDGLVQQRSVADDDHAARADQPHHGAKNPSEQCDGDGDDVETRVQLHRRETVLAELQVAALELADQEHAEGDEDDVEKQPEVGEQAVDAEHGEDDGVVAREVAEVVVDTRLHLAEVGGLADALDVEELGDGPQVREAAGERPGAHAGEALRDVQARRQNVYRDLDAGHVGRVGGSKICALPGKMTDERGSSLSGEQWRWRRLTF